MLRRHRHKVRLSLVHQLGCPLWALSAGLLLTMGTALAGNAGRVHASEAIFVTQLIVLMLTGRLLGEAAINHIRTPAVWGSIYF